MELSRQEPIRVSDSSQVTNLPCQPSESVTCNVRPYDRHEVRLTDTIVNARYAVFTVPGVDTVSITQHPEDRRNRCNCLQAPSLVRPHKVRSGNILRTVEINPPLL